MEGFMENIPYVALVLVAVYCFGMWFLLAARSLRFGEDHSQDTFHLGLCGTLALGFLLLNGALT
jgi:hypothetical protein